MTEDERKQIKQDIDCDRRYLAGLRAGWNLGQSDNSEEFDRQKENFTEQILRAERSMKLSAEQQQKLLDYLVSGFFISSDGDVIWAYREDYPVSEVLGPEAHQLLFNYIQDTGMGSDYRIVRTSNVEY